MATTSSLTNTSTDNPLAKYQAGATSSTTKSATDAAKDKLTSDYTTFLKLLTTQLQNQDPTNPMDSAQFTQQLVQYSQVEQQIKSNEKLDALLAAQNSAGVGSSLGYLGKTIEMDGAYLSTDATSGGSFNYTLSDVATTATIKIYNESGTLVRTSTGSGTLGKHTVTWDGKDDDGHQLPAGVYGVSVTATNSSGASVTTKVSTNGKVDGVEKDSSGAVVLDVGKLQVTLDKILGIHDTPTTTVASN